MNGGNMKKGNYRERYIVYSYTNEMTKDFAYRDHKKALAEARRLKGWVKDSTGAWVADYREPIF